MRGARRHDFRSIERWAYVGERLVFSKSLLPPECCFSSLRVQVPTRFGIRGIAATICLYPSPFPRTPSDLFLFTLASRPTTFLPRGNTRQRACVKRREKRWNSIGLTRVRLAEGDGGTNEGEHFLAFGIPWTKNFAADLSPIGWGSESAQLGRVVLVYSSRACVNASLRFLGGFFYHVLRPSLFLSPENGMRAPWGQASRILDRLDLSVPILPDDDVREDKSHGRIVNTWSWLTNAQVQCVLSACAPLLRTRATKACPLRVFRIYTGCRVTDDTRVERGKTEGAASWWYVKEVES